MEPPRILGYHLGHLQPHVRLPLGVPPVLTQVSLDLQELVLQILLDVAVGFLKVFTEVDTVRDLDILAPQVLLVDAHTYLILDAQLLGRHLANLGPGTDRTHRSV